MAKLEPTLAEQAAVVPYRVRRRRVEIALVTSSGGSHWVVPKGSIERGETPRESALREALEEAGLVGKLHGRPVGSFRYEKESGRYRVRVYLLRVDRALDRWPEDGVRERVWVSPAEARSLVRSELRSVLTTVCRRLAAS